jgi:tRNA threonylcarbamoyl adenosine modification protein YeaZ
MKYLFVDTSMHDLTIAISTEEELIGCTTSTYTNEHSKYALSQMKSVFTESSLKPEDIDKIIVVNGPGSFTGVRIGVTICKTYAWALKKEIIPISSLLTYALSYDGYKYYVCVINARRNFVYAAIYNEHYDNVLEQQYISIDKLNTIISSLDGSFIVIGDIDIVENKANPVRLNILKIVQYCKNKQAVEAHLLVPNYLKMVEAEEKMAVSSND